MAETLICEVFLERDVIEFRLSSKTEGEGEGEREYCVEVAIGGRLSSGTAFDNVGDDRVL